MSNGINGNTVLYFVIKTFQLEIAGIPKIRIAFVVWLVWKAILNVSVETSASIFRIMSCLHHNSYVTFVRIIVRSFHASLCKVN
jgi:hypothetical protein